MVWPKVDRIERLEWSDWLERTTIHSAIIQPVICNQSLIDQTAQSNQSNGDVEFSRYCNRFYAAEMWGHLQTKLNILSLTLCIHMWYRYNQGLPRIISKVNDAINMKAMGCFYWWYHYSQMLYNKKCWNVTTKIDKRENIQKSNSHWHRKI